MRANFQSYPLRIRPSTRLTQVDIMQHLLDRGVASRRGSERPSQPAYHGLGWACGPDACDAKAIAKVLPRPGRSEEIRDNTILIPLFHGMTEAEQDFRFRRSALLAGVADWIAARLAA